MPNATKSTGAKSAKPAKQRNVKIGGSPASKPAANAAAPASKPVPASKPADTKPAVARVPGNVTRTIATIARQATNFNGLSDRDSSYLAFYAGFAKRTTAGTVTIADIHASGLRPSYSGSNKPHDAGVIVRLCKANILRHNADGFTFTDHGRSYAGYSQAKPHPVAAAPKA